jgi:hypothetical protein
MFMGPLGTWRPGGRASSLLVLAVVAVLSSCGGVEAQFIGNRVLDECGGQWNVCATTAGCILGDRSYVAGRFPGTNRAVVTLFEPSQVTVSFYLSETTGSGLETVVNFHEGSCAARTRVAMTGAAFVAESQQVGLVARSADLSSLGDHLVEVQSDARTRYLLKVDVLPLRLRDGP